MPEVHATLDRLELAYLYGWTATYLPGESFGPRVMHDYELVWIQQGDIIYEADGRHHDAPEGSILITRPGFREHYHWDRHRSTQHAFFHFDIVNMPGDWPATSDWPIVRAGIDPADVMRPIFRRVLDQWCGHHRGGERVAPPRGICRLVETLISTFLAPTVESSLPLQEHHPQAVQLALDLVGHQLDDDPRRQITLEQLAQAASVSPKHLIRLFNTSLGVSPMRAVRLMRLSRTLTMMSRSNLSLKQIASRCGFASPYHFSRCFTEAYRQTPSRVRRNIEAGLPPPLGPLAMSLPGS